MLRHDAEKLPPAEVFPGAGIYAIYYRGKLPLYGPLVAANAKRWRFPIYVGKATPPGGRKGKHFADEAPLTSSVYKRLQEHAESISQTKDLNLDDFRCRHLFVDEIWISLAESLLIDITQPVWNCVLDGFGNHPVGKQRSEGQRPTWDTLHPGREWARDLSANRLTPSDLISRVTEHLREFFAHPPDMDALLPR
ncbi:Eco29kI family restriction endonuclease [candidate division WOR-3 bacterium]|uniref:Eco29kI family restriction endonuclease n=1 Tax=candidate division WOR-3 bacterium TaxID=2052148 RepID=A0A938BVC9_UNCW3|nr:Eco29kI family restriction endonuclease [candidate division WOR-3 bacterium]